MWLVPIVVVLAIMFVAIALAGGVTGVGAALLVVGLVTLLVARARRG